MPRYVPATLYTHNIWLNYWLKAENFLELVIIPANE